MVRKKISPGTGTRRKIAIEKIEDEDARHVCFSKRRSGLFTKASDLATLCGAEVAIVINSIADNPYSFGSPGVFQVIDRYLASDAAADPGAVEQPPPQPQPLQCVSALGWLNEQCMLLGDALDTALERKSMLDERQETLSRENEICKLVVELHHVGLSDLDKLKNSLDGLKATATGRIDQLAREEALSAAMAAAANCPRKAGVARARLGTKIENEHIFLEPKEF